MGRGKKKWISLQLIRHKKGLEEIKQKKIKRKETGEVSDYSNADLQQLKHRLNYAWKNGRKIAIIYLKDGKKTKCESKIEMLRPEKPRIILKNGNRLNVDAVLQLKILD